jgi:hypothetical protein
VRSIYFGHGAPLLENAQQTLRHSLENVLKEGRGNPEKPS